MKTVNYLIIILCICISCKQSTLSENKNEVGTLSKLSSIDSFFPKEKTKVLVVGTFHFNYPGLDSHKTDKINEIDVLKEPKKSEVIELAEYIKQFRPTKIAIEALEGYEWNTKYKEYLNGEHRQKRDERYQLGMRIAMDLKLDTLYPIDAGTLTGDLFKKDSIFYKSLSSKIDWEVKDPYWDMAVKYLDNNEKELKDVNLLDYFKDMNSRRNHNFNYGLYLTGNFSSGGYQGADHLSMWWYNRNARIFSNIIKMNPSKKDRILVIMGNGHAALLRQFIEASPQFEFVEFDSL